MKTFLTLSRMQVAVLVLVGAASVAIGFFAYRAFSGTSPTAATAVPVAVQRGALQATITAPGSVVSTKQAKLNFGAAGKLAELPVTVGDQVKAGQLLAKLDTSALEIKLAQAQSSLRVAQIKLQQLKQGPTAEDQAAAQSAYDAAAAKYNQTAAGPTGSEVQSAQQSVISAQAAYDKAVSDYETLKAGPDAQTVRLAEIDLAKAKDSLQSQQISRDGLKGNPNTSQYQKDAADVNLRAAELAVEQAQINYQIKTAGATAEQLAVAERTLAGAQAQLVTAQTKLAETNAKPLYADLLAAQSSLASAKSSLATKTRGATAEEIALQEESVKQAEASARQAETDVKNASILAPFDGVISATAFNVGEQVSGVMITLVDPKAMRVDVSVAEADIVKLAVGQSAQITLDALANTRLTGKVIAVSPTATVSQGVANYLVSISLSAVPSGTNLAAGLTASASIVVQEVTNVLMVPNRAVRLEGRSRVVDVAVGAATETRPVQIGMSNDTFTEIVSGLSDGDTVVIKGTTAAAARTSGLGGVGIITGGGVVRPPN